MPWTKSVGLLMDPRLPRSVYVRSVLGIKRRVIIRDRPGQKQRLVDRRSDEQVNASDIGAIRRLVGTRRIGG